MRIFGIASEIEIAKLHEEHGWILIDGESIEAGFKFVRDTFIFTDKRIILIDVQGITGRKKEYLSIPYDQISKFSVETPGPLDLDAEIKIWVRSPTGAYREEGQLRDEDQAGTENIVQPCAERVRSGGRVIIME